MEYFAQTAWFLASMSLAWIVPPVSSSEDSRNSQNLSSLLSSQSSSTGDQRTKKCCENDGLCVLGSFCLCSKQFYGQRCQYTRRTRSCGPVKHLQWARVGCNLCRCFDTNLTCLTRVYNGCDNKHVKTPVDIYDYQNDMEVFPQDKKANTRVSVSVLKKEDGDVYYYDYEDYSEYEGVDDENQDNSSNSSVSSGQTTAAAALSTYYYYAFPACTFLSLLMITWTFSILLVS